MLRKLFKGGNYSRAETIWENTVFFICLLFIDNDSLTVKLSHSSFVNSTRLLQVLNFKNYFIKVKPSFFLNLNQTSSLWMRPDDCLAADTAWTVNYFQLTGFWRILYLLACYWQWLIHEQFILFWFQGLQVHFLNLNLKIYNSVKNPLVYICDFVLNPMLFEVWTVDNCFKWNVSF